MLLRNMLGSKTLPPVSPSLYSFMRYSCEASTSIDLRYFNDGKGLYFSFERDLYTPRLNRGNQIRAVTLLDEKKSETGPIYECLKCGGHFNLSELDKYISFRCPECGYRIFRKVRPTIVKKVKAR